MARKIVEGKALIHRDLEISRRDLGEQYSKTNGNLFVEQISWTRVWGIEREMAKQGSPIVYASLIALR